ncbi:MAG: AAA family ATPase [Elusimicrobiota bacterium]
MFIKEVEVNNSKFPDVDAYPFNVGLLRKTKIIDFSPGVTFFIGENGTGKSTVLRAIAQKVGVHLWEDAQHKVFKYNKYAGMLHKYINIKWIGLPVKGSFFSSENFATYARMVDDWAISDPGMLKHYGGESLVTKSHGQCNMAFFVNRYKIKGVHFLDEPETALSPKKQLELLGVIRKSIASGNTQFIIATHSPLILSYEGAKILSYDHVPVKTVEYRDTEYYRIYKNFFSGK